MRATLAVRIVATGVVSVAVAAGSGSSAAAMPTEAPRTVITVDFGSPAGRLPADFVGLSFEMRELGIGNLDPDRGNLVPLFRTLGRSNLRIAGNTLDRDTLWAPAGQPVPDPLPAWVQDVVGPADVQRLDRFLRATGWRTEVGINLGRWDAPLAADQARVMFDVLGDRLLAAECGNEPDQWVGKGFRPAGYAYADYLTDWRACAAAVGNDRLAGPDAASPTSSWAAQLARDERARLKMIMIHQYSMDPTGTAGRLLSPDQNAAQRQAVTPNLAAATAAGLPLRVDETNSAWGGGINGVSNTNASALWALDYSMQLASLGVAGVNFHGGLGVCNEPIWNGKWQLYTPMCAVDRADETAQTYRAMPIYYGLWMARQMGPGRFLPVTVSTDRNITAYAVRGDDGRTRITVIHKDETSAAPVDVEIRGLGRRSTATVLRMAGSSLTADDTAVQGVTVDRSGRLAPPRPDRVRIGPGACSIRVAGGSALLLTIDGW